MRRQNRSLKRIDYIPFTRKGFERVVDKNKFFKEVYDTVCRFNQSSLIGTLPHDIRLSPKESDYLFCRTPHFPVYTCMTRLWHSSYEPFRVTSFRPKIEGDLILGLKLIEREKPHASIGCTISEGKTLEEEMGRYHIHDGFWPWDEILIDNYDDKKEDNLAKAKIWLHGDEPTDLSLYISRGILDIFYQNVLWKFKIPNGSIYPRYSSGRRSIPVLFEGTGRCGWIGS